MVAVLSNRDGGHSPHILYEISMALRCNKPALVFAEDSIHDSYIPKRVLYKRFSEKSYFRETTDHLYALEQLSAFIGKQQLPRYKGEERQRTCMLIGGEQMRGEVIDGIRFFLKGKGYEVKLRAKNEKVLPLPGDYHSDICHTHLAIAVLSSKSTVNSYILGALQSSLVPTVTLSIGDYPLIKNVPEEYQRRILSNSNFDKDIDTIRRQIELFEEDFLEIDSFKKAEKYADKLATAVSPGHYTHEFRSNLIMEVIMGDKFEAGQVGAQGPNAHAHDMTFNQIWQQNKEKVDLSTLNRELEKLRNTLQTSAETAEHYSEIGAIATAEIEANKGNGANALHALSKAGKWSLGVAEKIGVGVATAALKTALGI